MPSVGPQVLVDEDDQPLSEGEMEMDRGTNKTGTGEFLTTLAA
jgi:hypothetical protein